MLNVIKNKNNLIKKYMDYKIKIYFLTPMLDWKIKIIFVF